MAEKMSSAKPAPLGHGLDALGWIGHVIPALLGVLAIVAAIAAWMDGIQKTFSVTLVLAGSLLPFLAWRSLRGSRAAWSFLVAFSAVLGGMTLLGAPKIRNLVGVDLGVAAIVPLLFAFAVFALSMQGHHYRMRS